jgi:hypothetical protein
VLYIAALARKKAEVERAALVAYIVIASLAVILLMANTARLGGHIRHPRETGAAVSPAVIARLALYASNSIRFFHGHLSAGQAS